MNKYLVIILSLFFLNACKESDNKNKDVINNKDSLKSTEIKQSETSKIEFEVKPQSFTISSNKITELKGKEGLKITVDPSVLETVNGGKPGNEITVYLKEVTNQEQLFENDAPTVSNGRLLVSGGAYYIGMTSDGNELKLKADKKMLVQIPKKDKKDMELFYGSKDSNGILNWVPAYKKITITSPLKKVTKPTNEVKNNIPVEKQVAKQIVRPNTTIEEVINFSKSANSGKISKREFDSLFKRSPREVDNSEYTQTVKETRDSITNKKVFKVDESYYQPLEITNLGWINCDRFYDAPNKTKIECDYDTSNKISDISIYVIFNDINSMMKESISVDKKATSFSLERDYPVGRKITLIACYKKLGKFYNCKKILDLKDREKVKLDFTEVASVDVIKRSYTL